MRIRYFMVNSVTNLGNSFHEKKYWLMLRNDKNDF